MSRDATRFKILGLSGEDRARVEGLLAKHAPDLAERLEPRPVKTPPDGPRIPAPGGPLDARATLAHIVRTAREQTVWKDFPGERLKSVTGAALKAALDAGLAPDEAADYAVAAATVFDVDPAPCLGDRGFLPIWTRYFGHEDFPKGLLNCGPFDADDLARHHLRRIAALTAALPSPTRYAAHRGESVNPALPLAAPVFDGTAYVRGELPEGLCGPLPGTPLEIVLAHVAQLHELAYTAVERAESDLRWADRNLLLRNYALEGLGSPLLDPLRDWIEPLRFGPLPAEGYLNAAGLVEPTLARAATLRDHVRPLDGKEIQALAETPLAAARLVDRLRCMGSTSLAKRILDQRFPGFLDALDRADLSTPEGCAALRDLLEGLMRLHSACEGLPEAETIEKRLAGWVRAERPDAENRMKGSVIGIFEEARKILNIARMNAGRTLKKAGRKAGTEDPGEPGMNR
jgi:hypothetical protein